MINFSTINGHFQVFCFGIFVYFYYSIAFVISPGTLLCIEDGILLINVH